MSVCCRPALSLATDDPTLPLLYAAALRNLLDTNTVPGRGGGEPPLFIRAGAGYPDPWTRDAAINAWGGASMLEPMAASIRQLGTVSSRYRAGVEVTGARA